MLWVGFIVLLARDSLVNCAEHVTSRTPTRVADGLRMNYGHGHINATEWKQETFRLRATGIRHLAQEAKPGNAPASPTWGYLDSGTFHHQKSSHLGILHAADTGLKPSWQRNAQAHDNKAHGEWAKLGACTMNDQSRIHGERIKVCSNRTVDPRRQRDPR